MKNTFTHTQNIGAAIVELMTEEAQLRIEFAKANEIMEYTSERVALYEEAYGDSEDELAGLVLDEAYLDYEEATEEVEYIEGKIELITETLELLREAMQNIEWLR